VAEDLGPLAVQAGPHPGSDIIEESLPYISGGDEAANGLHAWVCVAMQVVKNLSAEVPGGPVADFLCDNGKIHVGVETLYSSAEDLERAMSRR
jgi:hypothetical protein